MKSKKDLKNKNIEKNNAKGITLIALVITIIVLLILAGVSIAMLTGDNGIITQANKSKVANEKATAKEKVQVEVGGSRGTDGKLDYELLKNNLKNVKGIENAPDSIEAGDFPLEVTVDGYKVTIADNGTVTVEGDTTGGSEVGEKPGKPDENGLFTERSTINGQTTGSKNNPLIPVGFKPVDQGQAVWGDGTTAPAQSSVDAGLVIEDGKENQFVWVPVDYSEFVRREGYYNGSLDSKLSSCGEADSTGNNSKFTETTTTQAEAQAMYASVERNGGFYIGRYEAGKDGSGNVVVKQGADVYNEIAWSANGNMQETNGTTGGAVELARNFDTVNNYTGVTSTLIYGVQWDAVMKWMENVENPNVEGKKYIQDSTGMGWYSDNYAIGNSSQQTGIDLEGGKNKIKNIYDLAGNVREWTMESCSTYGRVYRGGYFDGSGSSGPASYRSSNSPSNSVLSSVSVSLYICKAEC